jgi:hypothetical protein
MKRALAVCTVLAVLGFSAFGIGTFSGKWDFSFCTPVWISTNALTINYTDFGWTFTGALDLVNLTFKFTTKGAFGPLSFTSNMYFDISPADYNKADLTTSLDLAGMSFSLKVEHWSEDDTPASVCPSVEEGALRYTLTTKVEPISLRVRFVDCCTGTEFYDAKLNLSDLSLCCGITYDVEFYFTKYGFEYVSFTLENFIDLCCGISLDAYVEFGTDYKYVSLTPKFAGIEACFTVYGDVMSEGGEQGGGVEEPGDLEILGLVIDGWKIRCELGDCSFIEIMTALSPEVFYVDSEGKIWQRPTQSEISTYGLVPLFNEDCGEFEYLKLAVCGPGCCGGTYKAELSAFFGTGGQLFDITKLSASLKVPVMANFTLNLSYSIDLCMESQNVCFGWTFSF